MADAVSAYEATLVGDQLPTGGAKWAGGVLAAGDNIYGIPAHARQVLCFDSTTQQATLVGDQLPGGGWMWAGGVLAADGKIYGIPHSATQVLCFDPRTQQAALVGDQLPGGNKWYGGVLAADGNIYGIPWDTTQVLRFDPRTQQATLVGAELPGNAKWQGGVLAADGNIYGIPDNATQVLRFDPRTQQATLVGAELPGDAKWSGGVLAADGNIYGIPHNATHVLRFNPRTQKATLVGAELPGGSKWMGGVLAADGSIYGIPCNATQVLRFDPRTQQATLVGDELPGNFKWQGGVLAADGNIYGIPRDATQVLRFTTPPLDAGPPAAPGDYASGGVSDKPSGVDRLGYTIYAKAIAATAREAESPSASLCVGIYARWGGGKSFLWTLIQRTLLAQALVETLERLHEQAKGTRDPSKAAAAADAFKKAVGRLRDPKANDSTMIDEADKRRFEDLLKSSSSFESSSYMREIFGLLVSSVTLFFASIDDLVRSGTGAYGIILGIISTAICVVATCLVGHKKIGAALRKDVSVVMFVLWAAAAFFLTFDSPFISIGIGHFAYWFGLAFASLWVYREFFEMQAPPMCICVSAGMLVGRLTDNECRGRVSLSS